MRKALSIILTTIALSGFMAIPITSAASSGACSGHDGVSCSAGHDTDGSVICNDGWKDSSVQYVKIKDVCAENYLEPGPFYDVIQTHTNRNAILYLYEEKIINGYPDLTFRPNNEINRAELLKILVEGSGMTPTTDTYNNCFSDVTTEWYAPYVCYAESIAWIDGYPDGSFKPAQTVNKVEAIKMLLNSQNIKIPASINEDPFNDVSKDEWFAPFIKVAKDRGILEETGSYLQPAGYMERGSISENLYRLLTYTLATSEIPDSTEAEQIIQDHCLNEWPNDVEMQKFCIEQQLESWQNLFNDQPIYTNSDQYNTIILHCDNEWHTDYSMQEFCRGQQYDGVEQINQQKPDSVTEDQYTIIVNSCTDNWTNDFAMQAFCYDQQFDAIETLNQSTSSNSVQTGCADEWPSDFTMRVFCEEQAL